MRFVPEDYVAVERTEGGASVEFYSHPEEPRENVQLLLNLGIRAFQGVCKELNFSPKRLVCFCMFHSREAMTSALGRDVPVGMLMTPWMSQRESVIVFQSPAIDQMNGDPKRMLRHLAHEVVHALVAEVTHSEKLLGDDNNDMRIKPWQDEGLAEVVAALVSDRREIIEASIQSAALRNSTESDGFSLGKLDEQLVDIHSPERGDAFRVATGLVWKESGGDVSTYFHNLRRFCQ